MNSKEDIVYLGDHDETGGVFLEPDYGEMDAGADDTYDSHHVDNPDRLDQTTGESMPLILSMAPPPQAATNNHHNYNGRLKTIANIAAPILSLVILTAAGITGIIALSTDYENVAAIALSVINALSSLSTIALTFTYGFYKQREQEKSAIEKYKKVSLHLRSQATTYQALEDCCGQTPELSTAITACQEKITQYYKNKLGKRYIGATSAFTGASLLHPLLAIAGLAVGFFEPTVSFGLNLGGSVFGTATIVAQSVAN